MLGQHIEADDFDTIWRAYLEEAYRNPDYILDSRGGRMFELEGISFTLRDPSNNTVDSVARDFNFEFAQKFFDWIMAGKTDPSELFGVNANAKNFADENQGRNTAYGPRILAQIDYIVDELVANPGSRRATITILDPGDVILLPQNTKMEFPCTENITFRIRDGELNAIVTMRSNCAVKTVCYDTYNFTNLQMEILRRLNLKGAGVDLGTYSVFATSYHFFERDLELVEKIIKEK